MDKLKTIAGVVLLATTLAGHAMANTSAQAAVAMNSSFAPTCNLGALTQTGATNAALASGATSAAATVNILNLANSATAIYQTGTVINLGMTGSCNYKHFVSLQTTKGGLKPTAAQLLANGEVAGSLPFIKHINYNAIVTWGGPVPTVLSTSASAGDKVSAQINGSFTGVGSLSLSLINPSGFATTPLIAGTYSDTLTLQIGAAL